MIPSLKSVEALFLALLTVLLLARTFLSIKVAEVMGLLEYLLILIIYFYNICTL